jgi:transaldolase
VCNITSQSIIQHTKFIIHKTKQTQTTTMRILWSLALSAALMSEPASAFQPTILSTRKSSQLAASALEELSKMTTLSIDSSDLDEVEKYAKTGFITDATTNPLLVTQAASKGDERYTAMLMDAVAYAKEKNKGGGDSFEPELNIAMDKLAVNLGAKLLGIIPGRVSTEVDIRLSYDTQGSVDRARQIIDMYEEMGVDKSRVLIKLAGTWEGIQAAKILEEEDIQCNITLVFSFLQAAAAAQAGAYLISPFPGRILDWFKSKNGREGYHPSADPGVLDVQKMYSYFRKYGYQTICMPASWRPSRGASVEGSAVDEILALAGVDEMTIPPPLLEALAAMDASAVVQQCDAQKDGAACRDPNFVLDEATFKQYWETDACAIEKLNEGIEAFKTTTEDLKQVLIGEFN